MKLRGLNFNGLNFKESLFDTLLSIPYEVKKHKYGANATWSHNTDTYNPSINGKGYAGEIYALKENLQVTTFLNKQSQEQYLPETKSMVEGGRVSIGSYDRTAYEYREGRLTQENYLDHLLEQKQWFKDNFGAYTAAASYGYGLQTFKEEIGNNYLGARNSAFDLDDYDYDMVDSSSFASTSRHGDIVGDWADVISDCNNALNNAISNSGWYRDFSHWHTTAKIKDFYEAQSPIIHANNVVTLGMSEAIEYMKFRQSVTALYFGTKSGHLYITADVPRDLLKREIIRTNLSVEIDLTGTDFAGKNLSSSHGLISMGNDKYIVEIPYNGVSVLKEHTTGEYLDFSLPTVISQTAGFVTTDKPTRLSIWGVTKGAELEQAVLVDRYNASSTTHEFEPLDTANYDYYFGLITETNQSILHKYN